MLEQFVEPVRAAISHASGLGAVGWSPDALDLWKTIYRELADEKPGLLGAMTARGEAQIIRIALIYALLDQSPVIESAHLRAAKAVWDYCDKSAQYLFGTLSHDSLSDQILRHIRQGDELGLTRTELSRCLSGNKLKAEIDSAITPLLSSGLISSKQIRSESGKTTTRYFANS